MGMIRNATRALAAIPRPARRGCVVCGARVGRFLSYRGGSKRAAPLMLALRVIGSDIDNFECPRCGAHDRERHLVLYFRASGLFEMLPRMRVLHFAPERRFSKRIRESRPADYVACDLYPHSPGIQQVDIEAMPFGNASFDLVIANHVLEHVADDQAATAEIYRVLKPGGRAVLQTPFSPVLERTWSDPGIDDDAARLEAYGQEDHVRLFGRDIFERIAQCGLRPRIASHSELLASIRPEEVGVNPREPFFLFTKDS